MGVKKIDNHLSYIDIFDTISPWVYKDENLCFLVDPGPMICISPLMRSLRKLGIGEEELDYILLTHIHIDHAGSVGKLVESFPQARVVCHPNGIDHLVNPEKLWEKSVQVLGKGAEMSGKFEAVPKDRIITQDAIKHEDIRIIETLGHAPHHQSYLFKNYLFIGEAAGSIFIVPEIDFIYPATPPIFDYDNYLESIEKLLKEDLDDYIACYPHMGMRENVHKMIKLGYDQITTWMRVFNELYEDRDNPEIYNLLMDVLKKECKIFANYDQLSVLYKNKVPNVIRDSIKGIFGYI